MTDQELAEFGQKLAQARALVTQTMTPERLGVLIREAAHFAILDEVSAPLLAQIIDALAFRTFAVEAEALFATPVAWEDYDAI